MSEVFVFGSNLAGRHGAGSALEALRNHGAIYGQGWGRQGNSYAIPTKDQSLGVLSLDYIKRFVDIFLRDARDSYNDTFTVVAIGCGLAGYTAREIAPMFRGKTPNVHLPKEFEEVLHRLYPEG